MGVSLVIPILNEEKIIWGNTETLLRHLDRISDKYEIVLVENGSRDQTPKLAAKLSVLYPRVNAISLPEPCLGEALRRGVANAVYDKIIYFPIDLSVNLDFIQHSVELLETHDIVIGSKRLGESEDNRPAKRRIASHGYHKMVKLLFRTDLSDTTCVKAYRRTVALELMNSVPSSSSIYETEVLLEAQNRNLRMIQIPVLVDDQRKGKLPLRHKIASKGQDLASIRVDVFSLILGGALLLVGSCGIIFLSVEKLVFGREGFLNPYSFLLSMLLILFGVQGISYGLFARLFLQLRKEITLANHRDAGNVFKEEAK